MTTQVPSTLINWVNPPSAPSQSAKYVFAAPNASGGVPAFRQLVVSDILGIGTAASLNTGTSGANIPLLNGVNTWAAAQAFSVRPTFNGNTPWDNGNLPTPASLGAAGSFTTLSASGLITPTSTIGIKGTVTNDSAQAGSVGEFVTNNATGVSLSSGTSSNITSISLTAGDWDVSGVIQFSPAGTTVMQLQYASVNTVSATGGALGSATNMNFTSTAGNGSTVPTPVVRLSLTATTTVYLVSQQFFTTSTCTAGGLLRARRVR